MRSWIGLEWTFVIVIGWLVHVQKVQYSFLAERFYL
jgi:hypothetical protein